MVDDELLQELLSRATGLYGNGDYRGAIEAWREALGVDPSSQRAREGIQMATLLLADFDPAATNAVAGAPPPPPVVSTSSPIVPPAPAKVAPDPAAAASRLDAGIRRVRELLKEGQYSEAIEGARGLVPIDPDSEEVQRLVEEAEQAFESAPFIDEHLTLSRELLAQDRREEAEAECRKVFALDPSNPDAHALIATIRASAPAPPAPAAAAEPEGDLGGRTMRIDRSQLQALHAAAGLTPEKAVPAPEPEADALPAAPAGDEAYEIDLDAGAGPAEAEAPVAEADLLALPDLDALPDDLLEADPLPPAEPMSTEQQAAAGEPETVDATTVVPSSVRLVTRTGDPNESVERLLQPEADEPAIELTPTLKKEAPAPAPAPAKEAPKPSAKPSSAPGGWEQELETLNRKTGEHEIVGRAAARAKDAAAPKDEDLDLSSLLGDEIGPLQGVVDEHEAPAETSAIPLSPAAAPAEPATPREPAAPETDVPVEEPPRPAARPARGVSSVAPAPSARGSRSLSAWFAMAGVVLLAVAAAVWWFFLQPRAAAARSLPPAAAAPPSGSSGTQSRAGAGPIPTPIGSTSRQATPETAVPQSPAPAPKPAPANAPPAAATQEPAAPAPAPPKPRTPEEARQEAAQQKAKGKAALAAGQWVAARDAFAAVMALDPVDFESKTLLDQVQVKVDEEKKVHGGYDEARKLFDDRDYQGALWKLYRLPQDGRLGNLDVPVRNAWFNWAVVALKGGDATDARQKLQEVLSVDPGDAEAAKMMDLATTYASRPKDRTFYSFVDSLRFRAFDRK